MMELLKDFDRRSVLMADLEYNMSFTAGGLFYLESPDIAEIYFDCKSWDNVKEKAHSDNTIQSKTQASLKRFSREIISRLQLLSEEQLALLLSGNAQEKKGLLWIATCKKHKFINDFAVEVVREKFLHLDFKMTYRDFDMFFNKKSEWHPELEKLTTTTRNKIRQVLFRMMREADILLPNDEINRIHFSQRLSKTISKNNKADFLVFPLPDAEISRLMI